MDDASNRDTDTGGSVLAAEHRDNAAMVEVMRRVLRRDSCCVDVGAHSGNLLEQMVRLAPRGRHYAFEPLPHLARIARKRLRLFRVIPHPLRRVRVETCAVGDTDGTATFHHVVTNPGYSGLRPRTYERDERVERLTVPVRTLDTLLPRDYAATLVKVDVEGAELAVFRGGREFFRRSRPHVLFEFGLGAADHYGTQPEDLFDLLTADFGLRVSAPADFLAGRPPFSREAFCATYRAGGVIWNFLAHP